MIDIIYEKDKKKYHRFEFYLSSIRTETKERTEAESMRKSRRGSRSSSTSSNNGSEGKSRANTKGVVLPQHAKSSLYKTGTYVVLLVLIHMCRTRRSRSSLTLSLSFRVSQNYVVNTRFPEVAPTERDVSSHTVRKIFDADRPVIQNIRLKNVKRIGIKDFVRTEDAACFSTTSLRTTNYAYVVASIVSLVSFRIRSRARAN